VIQDKQLRNIIKRKQGMYYNQKTEDLFLNIQSILSRISK